MNVVMTDEGQGRDFPAPEKNVQATAYTHKSNAFIFLLSAKHFIPSYPLVFLAPTALTNIKILLRILQKGQTYSKQPRCQISTGHIDYKKGAPRKTVYILFTYVNGVPGRGVWSSGPIAHLPGVE